MREARENARAAIAKMAQGPLNVAGRADVRVAVSFPGEPKDTLASPVERWDVSRSQEEVLEELRNKRR
jgi:hypothetical protein